MSFWTYQNLADVTQGRWLVEPDDVNAEVAGLWHDTRELQPGQAYLAIKGETFDGHAFIDRAFDAGAALAIVQSEPPSLEGGAGGRVPSQPVLQVDNTITALQALARAYRDELQQAGCKVIGVAGSNGKTTTRHLIHHILTHAGLTGTQSPKSFNNHLGVPLTLLGGKPQDDFIACEIGTNHPGEIDFLSAIVRPDIAVITSIGEEHLEFFKNIRNVAKEEACIFDHLVADGIGLAPDYDLDRYLRKLIHREGINLVPGWHEVVGKSLRAHLLSMGEHMFSNAQLAGSVADLFEIDMQTIQQAILQFKTPSGRCEYFHFDGVTVIHDAYNANPTSTRAAIDLLSIADTGPVGRKVFVFGDMLEQGERSKDAHSTVGAIIEFENIELFITIGQQAKYAAATAEMLSQDNGAWKPKPLKVQSFDQWTNRTPGDVADLLRPGDTVLLKASRGMALERLIPAIERRFGAAPGDEPT